MGLFLIALYSIVLLGIGFLSMRRIKSVGDYFLGGRSIGPWVSAFAYGTTYFSAVLFIGFAGKLGWSFGLDALWVVAGNTVIGTFLAWKILAKRTRFLTSRLDAMTLPQFLGARYQSRFLTGISALIIFFFLLPYSASVFIGLSYLFEVTFGISYATGLLVMCVVTAAFLVMGGYRAVALTDVVMGALMIVGAIMLLVSIVGAAGGLGTVLSQLPVRYSQHVPKAPGFLGILPLVLMTSLGPLALPQMVQKFYAIKNERVIFTATVVASPFALIITLAAYLSGAMTHLFFDSIPSNNPDLLMPSLISNTVSPVLLGLVVLLVLAASMSTLSSLVLVSASSVAMDLYARLLRPQASRHQTMLLLRGLSAVFVLFSMAIAISPPSIIVYLMSMSWGTVAGSFLAPFLYGLFWKPTTKAGAIAGVFSGFAISVGLYLWWGQSRSTEAAVIAMLAPLVVVPLVSMVTKPFSEQHLALVFGEEPGHATGAERA